MSISEQHLEKSLDFASSFGFFEGNSAKLMKSLTTKKIFCTGKARFCWQLKFTSTVVRYIGCGLMSNIVLHQSFMHVITIHKSCPSFINCSVTIFTSHTSWKSPYEKHQVVFLLSFTNHLLSQSSFDLSARWGRSWSIVLINKGVYCLKEVDEGECDSWLQTQSKLSLKCVNTCSTYPLRNTANKICKGQL